jgi:hypothetical protein
MNKILFATANQRANLSARKFSIETASVLGELTGIARREPLRMESKPPLHSGKVSSGGHA